MNVEAFSCSGGMAEGFRRAGIAFDLVFDKDPDAVASYEKNLGHRPVQMDFRDVLRIYRAGGTLGPIDLFVADPPCTPWSRAGKRLGVEDERDMLRATCEFILLAKPRAYLIGNVPGLDDSTQWHHVQEALAPLRKAGYCIADYASLDAADFGVPQHRVRPFWFGHLSGPCVRWPLPTHGPPGQAALPGLDLRPWVTCREALQHLPLEILGRPVRVRNRTSLHPCTNPDQPAKVVPSSMPGNGGAVMLEHGAPHPRHAASEVDAPAFAVKTNGGRVGSGGSTVILNELHPPADPDGIAPAIGAKDRGHGTVLDLRSKAWPWNRPSTTACAGIDKIAAPSEHEGHKGPNAVVLSELAATILQGFPETWVFSGATKRARWSQIGQAMPPPLAHAVATSVAEQLTLTAKNVETVQRVDEYLSRCCP